jgi:hypothetical protein
MQRTHKSVTGLWDVMPCRSVPMFQRKLLPLSSGQMSPSCVVMLTAAFFSEMSVHFYLVTRLHGSEDPFHSHGRENPKYWLISNIKQMEICRPEHLLGGTRRVIDTWRILSSGRYSFLSQIDLSIIYSLRRETNWEVTQVSIKLINYHERYGPASILVPLTAANKTNRSCVANTNNCRAGISMWRTHWGLACERARDFKIFLSLTNTLEEIVNWSRC